MACTVAIPSMPPAAPRVCPVIDLVEETGGTGPWPSQTALKASVSLRSFASVLVPWALM